MKNCIETAFKHQNGDDIFSFYSMFEKEIFAIIQACEHYPVLLDPGVRAVFFTDRKNIGDYVTTMLASGRVSGKVHRWMASLGEGFVRGIKELRYIRGEENWIADALSRIGGSCEGNPSMDSNVRKCLNF